MRLLGLLFLTAMPASAQIYADVSTTLGDFSIELYHEESPLAVANFVTLAEGSRAWIDSTTGEVRRNTPYYEGITFHRVIDGFMNQAGSQDGTGGDGPGYNFPDEIDNGLLHDEPYMLSAANSGPHTNGSQFFTTVVPTPWLDGLHTVFGKVVDGTETIDTINDTPVSGSSPVTPVVINSVSIRRVGAEALAFDEFAQGLPKVTGVGARVEPPADGEPARLVLDQTAGTTLKVSTSGDLASWFPAGERYLDQNSDPLESFVTGVDGGKAFFRSSLVEWPADAEFPDSLNEGILVITDAQIGTFTLDLGGEGTIVLSRPGTEDISAPVDFDRSGFDYDGYGCNLLVYSDGLVPIRFRLGMDLPATSPLSGRVSGTAFTQPDTTRIAGSFTFGSEP